MNTMQQRAVGDWMRPAQSVFEFWVSFWPTAPLFGVDWRFAPKAGKKAAPAKAPAKRSKAEAAPATAVPVPAAPAAAQTAAQTAPAPVAQTAPAPVKIEPAADGKPAGLLAEAPAKVDDLKQIKGIGPSLERQLNGLGIYTFEQIAGLSDADLGWIDDNLTSFKGRCFRDDWVGQAKALLG